MSEHFWTEVNLLKQSTDQARGITKSVGYRVQACRHIPGAYEKLMDESERNFRTRYDDAKERLARLDHYIKEHSQDPHQSVIYVSHYGLWKRAIDAAWAEWVQKEAECRKIYQEDVTRWESQASSSSHHSSDVESEQALKPSNARRHFRRADAQQRRQAIAQIEKDFITISKLTEDIAKDVEKQEEQVNALENHVEDSVEAVGAGNVELDTAVATAKAKRHFTKRCMIWALVAIGGILLVVAVVLLVYWVLQKEK